MLRLRAWDMQEHQEAVSELSKSFASYTGLSISVPMCLSYSWAEALCGVAKSDLIRENNVLLQQPKLLCSKPDTRDSESIVHAEVTLLWTSGPMVQVEVYFPGCIDISWTHFVDRISQHCPSFRPLLQIFLHNN